MENKTIVTDEQVGLLNKTLDIGQGGDIENGSIINFIEAYNESLSTEQLKQLCEAKGLGVVDWGAIQNHAPSKMTKDEFNRLYLGEFKCELPQRKEN